MPFREIYFSKHQPWAHYVHLIHQILSMNRDEIELRNTNQICQIGKLRKIDFSVRKAINFNLEISLK